jgi:hypothetical protein
VNRDAIDVLHRQVEIAIGGDAAIEHACYVRVLQAGENLALLPESLPKELGGEGKIDELDGDALIELAVGPMGKIDGAHTAAADQAIKPIWADKTLGEGRIGGPGVDARFGKRTCATGLRLLFFFPAGFDQQPDFRGQLRIVLAARVDERGALVSGEFEGLMKDGLHAEEALRSLLH